jgi:GAF domain-containing protein
MAATIGLLRSQPRLLLAACRADPQPRHDPRRTAVGDRLICCTFTTDRIDAVTLIAGQLAVSLDNAQLYAEFTA